jgi:hypothetical protein
MPVETITERRTVRRNKSQIEIQKLATKNLQTRLSTNLQHPINALLRLKP